MTLVRIWKAARKEGSVIVVAGDRVSRSPRVKRLVVVINRSATWRTRFAARQLVHYVSRILGTKIPLVDSRAALSGTDLIYVSSAEDPGTSGDLVEMGVSKPVGLRKEGFTIRSFRFRGRRGLLILGKTDLAALYGAYHYLEKVCKVGFFWSAEHVPRLKELPLEGIQLVENSRFSERYMTCPGGYSFAEYWTWSDWKRELEFRVKKKQNLMSLFLGSDIVWNEVLARHGIPAKPLSADDLYRDRLAKRVSRYARKLGLRLITPAFMGDVPREFAAANPQIRYVEMRKWDLTLPKSRHIHPSDPMFMTLGEEFLRAYASRYGTDHYYFIPPYPEAYAGSTPEEKKTIKVDFAKAVQAYMQAADPQWRWLADSWTFFTTEFWPPEDIREFCKATDPARFVIYDTWGEERPLYKINDYYQGRFWALGVLHSFGGNTTLRGNLQGLIDSVNSIVRDPEARRCIGIYLVPEVIHHNDLYFDLIMTLSWKPGSLGLEDYLADYALRRYGAASAPKMARVLERLARTVYGDNDLTQPLFLRRLFDGFDTPNTEHYVPPLHATYAVEVRDALAEALEESPRLGRNRLYWRDLVDMARRYLGDVFNRWISGLYYAFDSRDLTAFVRYRGRIEECLRALEGVLWSWDAYTLERIESGLRSTPAFDPAKERNTRDMLSLWESEGLLDYVRRDDLAELFTNYYLTRVEAYVSHLESRLGSGRIGLDRSFLESAYTEAGRAWIDGPWQESLIRYRSPIKAVKVALRDCWVSGEDLVEPANPELANPEWAADFAGWHVSRSHLDFGLVEGGGPGDKPSLHFRGRPGREMKYLTVWQDIEARDDLAVLLDWRLEAFGPSSRAGLRLEVFDRALRKKAEMTYQFGDGRDFWPDRTRPDVATPDWRIGRDARLEWWVGFYAVKQRLGMDLDVWRSLTARPRDDLDRAHGPGTWDSLEGVRVRTSLIASARWAEDPLEGCFSNLRIEGKG